MTKSTPGHQRVEVHRNCPQIRAKQVEKSSRYTQIRPTDYDLRRNHQRVAAHRNSPQKRSAGRNTREEHLISQGSYFLGMSVSPYTEIVLKNVLSGSTNPPGTVKFALQTNLSLPGRFFDLLSTFARTISVHLDTLMPMR